MKKSIQLTRERLRASLVVSVLSQEAQEKVAPYKMGVKGRTLVIHCSRCAMEVVQELYPILREELWNLGDTGIHSIEFNHPAGNTITFPVCPRILRGRKD